MTLTKKKLKDVLEERPSKFPFHYRNVKLNDLKNMEKNYKIRIEQVKKEEIERMEKKKNSSKLIKGIKNLNQNQSITKDIQKENKKQYGTL